MEPIFHWKAWIRIFCESSLRSLAVKFLSRKAEKRDISPANSFIFGGVSSDRSLIQIKTKSAPRRDPWGIPASTLAQDEDWPFKATLCLWFWSKLLTSWRRFSDVLYWFNWKIKPSKPALPNPFYISRNNLVLQNHG